MSTPLSKDNGYQYPPEPAPAPFNREIANAVFGDIHLRIKAMEDKRLELQNLIDDLSFFGIQRLDTAINPLIDDVTSQVADLKTAVAKTLEDNSKIISDFQAVTAVNLDNLKLDIDKLEERVAVILAGGLDAQDVRESATRVFVTPAQKTQIGTLQTAVNTLTSIRFSFRGQWSALTNYVTGDVVSNETGLYRCTANHTATTSAPIDNPGRWAVVVEPIEVKVPNLDRIQRMATLMQFRTAI